MDAGELEPPPHFAHTHGTFVTCVSVGYLEGSVCVSKYCTSWLSICPISAGSGVSASVMVEKTRRCTSLFSPTATS